MFLYLYWQKNLVWAEILNAHCNAAAQWFACFSYDPLCLPGCLSKIIFVSPIVFCRLVIASENLLEKLCNTAGGYSDPIFTINF